MLIDKETNIKIVLSDQEAEDFIHEMDFMLSVCTKNNVFDMETVKTALTLKNAVAMKLFTE